MQNKFKRIGLWCAVWIGFTIIFVDFLPQHPHVTYQVLLSPFIIVMTLITVPTEVFDRSFIVQLYPGFGFWLITIILYFFPRKKKTQDLGQD